jgi:hypothetical protein
MSMINKTPEYNLPWKIISGNYVHACFTMEMSISMLAYMENPCRIHIAWIIHGYRMHYYSDGSRILGTKKNVMTELVYIVYAYSCWF